MNESNVLYLTIRTPCGVTPSCVYIKIQLNFYNGRAWGRKPGAELKAVEEKWPSKEVLIKVKCMD